jgi:hypothetical protein
MCDPRIEGQREVFIKSRYVTEVETRWNISFGVRRREISNDDAKTRCTKVKR